MAASRSMETIIKSYAITVAVPLHRPIATPKRRDAQYWEKTFEEYMNEESISAYKENFNRCIATLRWANSCRGFLENVAHGKIGENSAIELKFCFDDLKSLILFKDGLGEALKKMY